ASFWLTSGPKAREEKETDAPMLTAVPGIKVGHETNREALTGCTVILCPPGTKASCEVRGNSPGSRELALLAPEKSVQEVHAILLTGGSAFGLSAADGVMRWLSERSIGYQTPWAKVPIVPAAVVFDLNIGSSNVRPDSSSGYRACEAAREGAFEEGSVGAGTGTTVGKWKGLEHCMKGGVGSSSRNLSGLIVAAIAVVNAVGDVLNPDGSVLAGARNPAGGFFGEIEEHRPLLRGKVLEDTNTTLVVVATNARFSKLELLRISQRMHDGMARAIVPAHTSFDGDVSFALSCGQLAADLDLVSELAAQVTAEAIRRAVETARGTESIPGLSH
ncbi:MAG TPA: P1 family peptidase, partial [Bacteroidota bacterium]|nr:P1 family peptidase [Bacteroidota bacterium]